MMSVICPVCASPSLRGQVDADVVRRETLGNIAKKHGLSSRSVRRHVGHLPEKLEGEAAASEPSVYIGSVTYNINVFALPSDEEEASEVVDEGDADPEEEALGHA
jgi:hypothetical protein